MENSEHARANRIRLLEGGRGRLSFPLVGVDTDLDDRLTTGALLGFFQDAATLHASGIGMSEPVTAAGGVWLLARLIVELATRPRFPGQVHVETWCRDVDGLFFLRNFRAFDDQDRPFAEASSSWFVASRQKHRPLRPYSIMDRDFLHGLLVTDGPGRPRRFQLPEADYREVDRRRVRYSELDHNRHVNNTIYASYALDALAAVRGEQETAFDLRRLDLSFVRELRLGEEVRLLHTQLEGSHYVVGRKAAGENCFTARLELR